MYVCNCIEWANVGIKLIISHELHVTIALVKLQNLRLFYRKAHLWLLGAVGPIWINEKLWFFLIIHCPIAVLTDRNHIFTIDWSLSSMFLSEAVPLRKRNSLLPHMSVIFSSRFERARYIDLPFPDHLWLFFFKRICEVYGDNYSIALVDHSQKCQWTHGKITKRQPTQGLA